MKILETRNSLRLNTASPPTAHATAPVRFGCRVFAYVSSADYQGQDEFVRQCLLTGGNSMKRQNQLAVDEAGDKHQVALDQFNGLQYDVGRKAGWGIAYTPHDKPGKVFQSLTMQKSPIPAWQDANYDKMAEQAAKSHPRVLLTHLREVMWGLSQAEEKQNAHPFQYGDWALMQHGDLPRAVNEGLEKRLKEWHANDATSPTLKGEVDSERIACYVAAKFQQQFGSQEIGPQTTEQVKQVFRESVGEVIRWPNAAPAKASSAHSVYPGTYNLVMSEGNRVFATHYNSHSKMLVGKHTSPDGKVEYLLATDKIQPLRSTKQGEIVWQEIPDNTLLTLERNQDKQGKPSASCVLEPLLPEGDKSFYTKHSSAVPGQVPRISFDELSKIKGPRALLHSPVDESYRGKLKALGYFFLNGVRDFFQGFVNWVKRHIFRQKSQ